MLIRANGRFTTQGRHSLPRTRRTKADGGIVDPQWLTYLANRRAAPMHAKVKPRTGPSG